MLDGVDAFPELFAEPTELEDRVELRLACRLFQDMNALLGEGSVSARGPVLKPRVELVREVLDVERRHEAVLHIASILEDKRDSSQGFLPPRPEELLDVPGQELRLLHGGEVSAPGEVGPV